MFEELGEALAATANESAEDQLPTERAAKRLLDGLPPSSDHDHVETPEGQADLAAWRQLSAQLDRDNAVFMDTTSLAAVQALTAPNGGLWLTPLGLWDLCTFATHVVLCDRIYCLESQFIDVDALNRQVGDQVVHAIRVPDMAGYALEANAGVLNALWSDCDYYTETMARQHAALQTDALRPAMDHELEQLKAGWERVLGRPVALEDLFDADERQSWRTESRPLFEKLARFQNPSDFAERLDLPAGRSVTMEAQTSTRAAAVISECNRRGYFNHELSTHLNLPYAANAARLPMQSHLHARSVFIERRLPTLIDREFAELMRERAGDYVPVDADMTLPMMLTAALSRMSRPGDLLPALGELRALAGGFRARRRELDDAIRRRDPTARNSIHAAISDDQNLWSDFLAFGPLIGAVGSMLSLLAAGPVSWVLGGLSVITAAGSGLSPDARRRIAFALTQPQFRVLSRMSDTAAAVGDAFPKVVEVWQIDRGAPRDTFVRRLDGLAALEWG